MNKKPTVFQTTISTPLGDMLATADHTALHVLEFVDNPKPFNYKKYAIVPGSTPIFELLTQELTAYFADALTTFTVPLHTEGTVFQQQIWQQLCLIPYGTTISYAQLAQALHKPTAYRAAANANGANCIAIIIPCHRVITSAGTLGGYRQKIERKQWLLEHEKRVQKISNFRAV